MSKLKIDNQCIRVTIDRVSTFNTAQFGLSFPQDKSITDPQLSVTIKESDLEDLVRYLDRIGEASE